MNRVESIFFWCFNWFLIKCRKVNIRCTQLSFLPMARPVTPELPTSACSLRYLRWESYGYCFKIIR